MQAVGRADQRLLVALRTRGHSPPADRLVQGLGLFGELGSGWVALGLAGALLRPERRERWLVATGAAPAAILANYAVKLTIGRERPLIDDHPPLARAPSKLSFPSAHSTSSVAAAVVLGRVAPDAPAPPLYALAARDLRRPPLPRHALPLRRDRRRRARLRARQALPAARDRDAPGSGLPAEAGHRDPAERPAVPGRAAEDSAAMKVGIVGMPNAGKSTLFNALTSAGAEAAGYPFTTIEPNVAIAPVPDERLDAVAATIESTPVVHEALEVHDIAGLVRGAHAGEGLGNRFLGSIRETDAICHVVRAHSDSGVPHPDGEIDPVADAEMVEAELMLADLETATAAARARRQAGEDARQGGGRRARLARAGGRRARARRAGALGPGAGRRRRRPPAAAGADLEAGALRRQRRRGRGRAARRPARARPRRAGDDAIALSAKIEAELVELDAEEAAMMRAELGLEESGLGPDGPRRPLAARADQLLHRRPGGRGAGLEPAARPERLARRRPRSTPTSRTASSRPR